MKKIKTITKPIIEGIIYCFAVSFGVYLAILPSRIFFYHINAFSLLFRLLDRRRKFDCINNLDFVFGESLDSAEKRRILLRAYDNFAFVILNAMRLNFMSKERYLRCFVVHNKEVIENAMKNGNFIFVCGHYGDWEAAPRWVATQYPKFELSVVGRLTQFKSVNYLMHKSRQKFGSNFLDKKGVSKQLLKLLKTPKNTIGLVIDQNISKYEGIWVKMFGKDVTHTQIASILARKFNIPIIFTYIHLSADYTRFELHFELLSEAIISDDYKADIEAMTQLQASAMERVIREKPDEWFWFHKRFRSKYSHIYENKPNI